MALNFDYSKVKDNDRLFEYRTSEPEDNNPIVGSGWWQEDDGRWCRYQPWFDSIIMLSMILMPAPGWGITDKNVEKFVDRLMMYQAVHGPLLVEMDAEGKTQGRFVTPEQVRSLVGLKVNVSTVPENTFRKTLMRGVEHLADNLRKKIEQITDAVPGIRDEKKWKRMQERNGHGPFAAGVVFGWLAGSA